jgi:hypothetical protein
MLIFLVSSALHAEHIRWGLSQLLSPGPSQKLAGVETFIDLADSDLKMCRCLFSEVLPFGLADYMPNAFDSNWSGVGFGSGSIDG